MELFKDVLRISASECLAGLAGAELVGRKIASGAIRNSASLNVAWSGIFFGMRAIGPAFAEVLLLWTMTIATTVAFYPISLLAAWLLIPYIAWVAFASYLNFRIWQMN